MKKEILELLSKEPFEPFSIVIATGRSYEVRSPGLIMVGTDLLYYYHPHSTRWSAIRMVQIVALESID